MAWRIKIAGAAQEDIKEIKQWYKKQSDKALEDFTIELAAAIVSLKEDVTEFRIVYKSNRKLPLKKFPYNIFYRRKETEQIIIVNAVFHNQRASNLIHNRLHREE